MEQEIKLMKMSEVADATFDSACGCGEGICGTGMSVDTKETKEDLKMSETSKDYLVEGMTCAHCVGSVTKAVAGIAGVEDVEIELNAGGASKVSITSEGPIDENVLSAAIEDAGYSLVK